MKGEVVRAPLLAALLSWRVASMPGVCTEGAGASSVAGGKAGSTSAQLAMHSALACKRSTQGPRPKAHAACHVPQLRVSPPPSAAA